MWATSSFFLHSYSKCFFLKLKFCLNKIHTKKRKKQRKTKTWNQWRASKLQPQPQPYSSSSNRSGVLIKNQLQVTEKSEKKNVENMYAHNNNWHDTKKCTRNNWTLFRLFFFRVGFFMVYGLCQAASVWCGGENCKNRMRRRNELDEFFFSQRNE